MTQHDAREVGAATKHPGKTEAQRRVLDAIGCGEHTPPMTRRTRDAMLKAGLIFKCGTKVLGRDSFGSVAIDEYDMPVNVHFAWCQAMSAEYDAGARRAVAAAIPVRRVGE